VQARIRDWEHGSVTSGEYDEAARRARRPVSTGALTRAGVLAGDESWRCATGGSPCRANARGECGGDDCMFCVRCERGLRCGGRRENGCGGERAEKAGASALRRRFGRSVAVPVKRGEQRDKQRRAHKRRAQHKHHAPRCAVRYTRSGSKHHLPRMFAKPAPRVNTRNGRVVSQGEVCAPRTRESLRSPPPTCPARARRARMHRRPARERAAPPRASYAPRAPRAEASRHRVLGAEAQATTAGAHAVGRRAEPPGM
jgi:hypothetical protein